MKKAIFIFPVLALLFSACTNDLEFNFDQVSEILVMNAMLRTDVNTHNVRLSLSRTDEVIALKGAQVDCYVNGELVASGKGNPDDYREHTTASYYIEAEFHPGDEIRLEARKDALHASATVTVPQPATIVAVDTVHLARSPYFAHGKNPAALACRLHLQDSPGQPSWFRLEAVFHEVFYPHGYPYDRQELINFGFEQDPILLDGHLAQQGGNSFSELFDSMNTRNIFLTFRDTAFADGVGEPEIHIPYSELDDLYSFDPDVRKEKDIQFHLFTITEEEYDYLAQVAKSRATDMGVLAEPVHIPSNVEGGLGFVSVSAVSKLVLRLKE